MLVSGASNAVTRLGVKTALNPMLWLSGIICIPTLIVIDWVRENAPVWLLGFLILFLFLPVCTSIFAYVYLLIVDPDRLQSEDRQHIKQSLDIIDEKGGTIRIAPSSIFLTSNPEAPALPPPEGGEE